MRQFDVVVLGGGSSGEWFSGNLPGLKVAIVEMDRVGGSCPFVSCIPSKALLRSVNIRHSVESAYRLGATSSQLDLGNNRSAYRNATARKDRIVSYRNDSKHAESMRDGGATLFRGRGEILGPNRVLVTYPNGSSEEIGYRDLIVSTGSSPTRPLIAGLETVPTWSSEEALSSEELPKSLIILGGGAVGCELSQVYANFGVAVSVVESASRLLPNEEPFIGTVMAEILKGDGVDVRVGVAALNAEPIDQGLTLTLSDGTAISGERLLVATGRQPNVFGIGLESLGLVANQNGIPVDANCRVLGTDHLWAAGDVTGIFPFTHTANYQARIVISNLRGQEMVADYSAIPRAVYTDPPVASVGHSSKTAESSGLVTKTATMSFYDTARAHSEESKIGELFLLADATERVLIGASAIGPSADEIIGEATLAIRARVPLSVLADVVHAFPTYGEVYEPPLRELAELLV